MKIVKRLLSYLLFILILLIGGYILIIRDVHSQVDAYIYPSAAALPTSTTTALVLGAQVFPNQVPSRALSYRLAMAIDLYNKGNVKKLVMSGDGRSKYYNEVTTMQEVAVKAGVHAADIVTDTEGLRTYTSCNRIKEVYAINQVVIVTQSDHLLRAVYTCRKLGIDAVGIAAPEYSTFSITNREYWNDWLRERAALIFAWFEIRLSK